MSPSAQPSEPKPSTIMRHAFGVYPSIAMLAGMQLDVFTPLKDGPMSDAALARALGVEVRKLRRTSRSSAFTTRDRRTRRASIEAG